MHISPVKAGCPPEEVQFMSSCWEGSVEPGMAGMRASRSCLGGFGACTRVGCTVFSWEPFAGLGRGLLAAGLPAKQSVLNGSFFHTSKSLHPYQSSQASMWQHSQTGMPQKLDDAANGTHPHKTLANPKEKRNLGFYSSKTTPGPHLPHQNLSASTDTGSFETAGWAM